MSKYELSYPDEDAQVVVALMDMVLESPLSLANHSRELLADLRDTIRTQIPIPVPVKVGAGVRTDQGVFLRWTYDAHSVEPWIAANDVDTTLRTDDIGRITEVLSPGFDF